MNEQIVETRTCRQCSTPFPITDRDMAFYEKISPILNGKKELIPPPTLCPECRDRRRLAFRNERKLYRRKCDRTGRDIVSVFSSESPQKVFAGDVWWGDSWNPLDFGRSFDFSRPFFEQFGALMSMTPLQNLIGANNENSDYINLTADCKNCYIVIESSNNEDCLYGYWLQKCNDCVDSSFCHECTQTYEVQNCFGCHNLLYASDCNDCRDALLLDNCEGCHDCIACANLVNQSYHIRNVPYSPEEYTKITDTLRDPKVFNTMRTDFHALKTRSVKKYAHAKSIENSSGDYIQNTKNCSMCFDAYDAEDCKYGEHFWRNAKDVMDGSTVGRDATLIYEAINTALNATQDCFCIVNWSSTFMLYCAHCFSSSHCFGCVGLKNAQYCIFNKQYTKEEYEKMVSRIITHMRTTGEWGEFFDPQISSFGYNETVAMESYPLTREEAMRLGFRWSEYETPFPKVEKIIPGARLPDRITDIPDDILNWAIECEITKKPFRITKQELEFYRKHHLPIPRRHPDQRHLDRMSLRNPRKLFKRKCDKCNVDMQTTYASERPENIYCEQCYNKEIYG